MTSPVPANGGQPAKRPSSNGYTHRSWLDEMAVVLGHVAGVFRDFGVMTASLGEVGAGNTQSNLVGACHVEALHIMRTGVTFVDATDRRYMHVFEAIQSAGGQAEVVQDKRYHDHR